MYILMHLKDYLTIKDKRKTFLQWLTLSTKAVKQYTLYRVCMKSNETKLKKENNVLKISIVISVKILQNRAAEGR